MEIFNVWKNWRERKMKKNKGKNKSSSMSSVYTINPPIFHKFQPSRPYSSGEKCDKKFSCLKIGEKEKWKLKGWINTSSLFPVYTIHLPTVHVCTKYQPSMPEVWQKLSMFENWIERKMNKGTNMREQPDSGIHDTSVHCPHVYQVSIF